MVSFCYHTKATILRRSAPHAGYQSSAHQAASHTILSIDRACQDVVGRRLSERIAKGQSQSALNTSAYCEARQRLPMQFPKRLSASLSARLESMTPTAWRWQNRPVKLFDGTTVSMPDTPSNRHAYPQSREQQPGLGFPIARIGALIGLASGAILDYQVTAC